MKIIKHKCEMHACLMFLFVVVLISAIAIMSADVNVTQKVRSAIVRLR